MIPHLSHVMTLANSIIGVSVLAMPFCFKQCGIVLATLVLLTSSLLSRLACHFLIKSAVMSRRRNFEFLAFHAFGTTGKFLVELFIIGFLLGTCIAFFVVVGDLGPQIIAKMLNKTPEDIRTSVLVTTATFIVLPLGLLRNIDSLSSVCAATIGFYLCLVIKVICESTRHIFLGDWYDSVVYWRPAGILQCLPIFSMALFCQTQLFEIYEAIPNVCLEKMNQVVRGALNICTAVYLCVGFFGYVAFCNQPFTGNILLSFQPSVTSDVIKMGFVFSVAFSFPLVIFPCRASMNSLLFRRAHTHEPTSNYIPEVRFRCLTLTIVAMSLGTGILIPNIEFLLGIVGSTIGVMICLIFPAAFFIAISTKNTNERLIAQAILFFGMWIMVLGTYANIYAMEESSNTRILISTGKPIIDQINDRPFKAIIDSEFPVDAIIHHQVKEKPEIPKVELAENSKTLEVRREPPIPVERSTLTGKSPEAKNSELIVSLRPSLVEDSKKLENSLKDTAAKSENEKFNLPDNILPDSPIETIKHAENSQKNVDQQKNDNLIDSDAIKKEESELAAAAAGDADIDEARREKLRLTLEKHKIEQLEMMQEQKKLLEDIKEQKEELEMEKKRLADEKIEKKLDLPLREKNSPILKNIESSDNEKSNEGKIVKTLPKIVSNESRGPILNALTNWTLKKNSFPIISPKALEGFPIEKPSEIDEMKMEKAKKSADVILPIPLQMRNKTNISSIVEDKLSFVENKSANLEIRRDILEKREKRDASEENEENENKENEEDKDKENKDKKKIEGHEIIIKEDNSKNEKDTTKLKDQDDERCPRKKDYSENFLSREEINVPNKETTVKSMENLNVDILNVTDVNFSKLKKRDLKALRKKR